jgi:putative transcriptional regulator
MKSRLKILMAEKAIREERRISLRIVSEEAGVPMHTLKGLSTGKLHAISLDALDALARYFGCPLDDLFQREEPAGNSQPTLLKAA